PASASLRSPPPPRSPPCPSTTLFRSDDPLPRLGKLLFFSKSLSGDFDTACASCHHPALGGGDDLALPVGTGAIDPDVVGPGRGRSEEHTSELQSRENLVCRLLLEKKK